MGKLTTFKMIFMLLATLALMNSSNSLISTGSTTFDGVTQDQLPSFYSMDGTNGMQAPLDNRQLNQNLDYFIRAWIRPRSNYDMTDMTKNESFIDFSNTLRCDFVFNNSLICQSINNTLVSGQINTTNNRIQSINMNLQDLQTNTWIHISISGSLRLNQTYIKLDYQDLNYIISNASYVSLFQNSTPWFAIIGARNSSRIGFNGDIRELLIASQFINSSQGSIIRNQLLYWDFNYIGDYRLQKGNLNDSFRQNMTVSLLSNSNNNYPTWKYDQLANDICYSFQSTATIMKINTTNMLPISTTIDPRMSIQTSNYQYSVSLWLRILPGIVANSTFNQSLAFFSLQNVFSLWLSDPNYMRIYIHSSTASLAKASLPIFIPMNQWANVQFILDRNINSYEARVYDLQRRLLFSVSQNITLSAQNPSRDFTLFNNFFGYIKSIMIYQSRQTFPIVFLNGTSTIIADNSLILYYKFDVENFKNTSLQSLNNNTANVTGVSIDFRNVLEFETIIWEETLNYTNTTTLGTLNQTTQLYDGLACDDQKIIYNFPDINSYANYQLHEITNDLSNATVEMWFKKTQITKSLNYLFSLFSDTLQKEYFGIFQRADEQTIICKPVDSMNDLNSVEYRFKNNIASYYGWQHIACKFRSFSDITGLNYNDNKDDYIESNTRMSDQMIIPKGTYRLIIGNNFKFTNGQINTQIKEVRLWTEYRTDYNIIQFRQRQIDSGSQMSILAYFRLNSGDSKITNYVGLQANIVANSLGIQLVKQDSINQMCPLNTYPNSMNNTCMRNPFMNQSILILPTLVNNTLNIIITSNYSDKYFYSKNDMFSYQWISSDISQLTNQTQKESLSIYNFSNFNQTYHLKQKIIGHANSFFQESQIDLNLQNCSFVADNITNQTISYLPQTQNQGMYDINITFKENIIADCGIYRNQVLQQNISWTVFPNNLNINNFSYTFNITNKTFNLIIPKEEQNKFPVNMEVFFIAKIGWSKSDTVNTVLGNTTSTSSSYQNIVYVIKFLKPISPVMIATTSPYVLLGENITIDATSSFYIKNDLSQRSGISYQWTCPNQFFNLCSKHLNDRYITLTYNDFLSSNTSFNTLYNFNLTVWKSTDYDSSINYTTSIQVKWLDILRPQFTIGIQDREKVLASTENDLYLRLQNYDVYSELINIQWLIVPQLNSSLLVFSRNNTRLHLMQGVLNHSQSYIINVNVTYINYVDATSTQQLIINTGIGPLNGTINVLPVNGSVLSTQHSISISNWVSDRQPIKFKAYGLFNSTNQSFPIAIKNYSQSEILLSVLPQFTQIQFEISDASGELQIVQQNISVKSNSTVSLIDMINQAMMIQNQSQLLSTFQLTCYQLQYNDSQYQNQSLETKMLILNKLDNITSVYTVMNDDLSDDTINNVKVMMNILGMVSNTSYILNDTHMIKSLKIFKQLKIKTQAVKNLIVTSFFRQDYIASIGNMIDYSQIRSTQFNTSRRMLQEQNYRSLQSQSNSFTTITQTLSFMSDAISQQKSLSSLYCQLINLQQYKMQQIFKGSQFQYVIEKIPSYQFVTNRSYINYQEDAQVSLPIKFLISKEISLYQDQVSDICISVSNSYYNPLIGFNFTNQTITKNIPVIEISTMDNLGLKIIDNIGINASQNNLFNTSFKYQFSNTDFNFKNNQTVCLQIRNDYIDYSQLNWTYNYCQTEYNMDKNLINCKCSILGPYYYAIGNDYSRILILPPKSLLQQLWDTLLKFDVSIVAILFFIIFLIVIMPCVAIFLDKKDYDALKNNRYDITDDFLRNIALKKRQPLESIIYSKKKYDRYIKLEQLSFCQLFKMFLLELHPFINIFTKFDIELKRLIRLMFVIYQISFVAIISGIFFGTTYREIDQSQQARSDGADSLDSSLAVLVGFFWAIFTFPTLNLILNKCKSKLQQDNTISKREHNYQHDDQHTENDIQRQRKMKSTKDVSDHKYANNEVSDEFDHMKDLEDGKLQLTQTRLNNQGDITNKSEKNFIYQQDNTQTQQDYLKIDEQVIAVDNCILCKLIMLVICFVWAIIAMLVVSLESGANPKAHSIAMVICFYVSILIGYFFYNMILIMLITCLTPSIINQENENDGELTGCNKVLNCLFAPDDAKQMMRDMLLIYEMNSQLEPQAPQSQQALKPNALTSILKQNGPDDDVKSRVNSIQDRNKQAATFKKPKISQKKSKERYEEESSFDQKMDDDISKMK